MPPSARRAEPHATAPGSQKSASRSPRLARAGRKGVALALVLAAPAYAFTDPCSVAPEFAADAGIPCHVATVDAGTEIEPAVYAEQAQLLIPGGNWEEHGEGCFLPARRCVATGKELEQLRAENAALKAAPASTPLGIIIALAVGLTVGAAGGAYAVWKLSR
jgi:hypothetical protein